MKEFHSFILSQLLLLSAHRTIVSASGTMGFSLFYIVLHLVSTLSGTKYYIISF